MTLHLEGDDRRDAAQGAASDTRRGTTRARRWPGGWLWPASALTALSGGGWIAVAIREAPPIGAVVPMTGDLDFDGLPDQLENVLGTLVLRKDSDLDGWNDVEELARGSHPMRRGSVPEGSGISISMDAYRDGPYVHGVTAVYLPDGVVSDKSIEFVTAAGNELLTVPLNYLSGGNPTKVLPARDGVGRIIVLDPKVSADFVVGRNGLTLCGIVSDSGLRVAADSLTLTVIQNQIYEQTAKTPTGNPLEMVPSGLGVGGIYRPLINDPGEPSPGEICAQTMVVVGVINGVVLQEVAEADCVSGWDAYCAPGCAQLVGTQVKTIDPAAVIGN
jgi:hypothetical protein